MHPKSKIISASSSTASSDANQASSFSGEQLSVRILDAFVFFVSFIIECSFGQPGGKIILGEKKEDFINIWSTGI